MASVAKGAFAAALIAVAPAALAQSSDSILSRHVKEADGTTGQDTNSGNGIKTGHLQNGAVTSAKLAGPIPRSKLERYANVAVVAIAGGDYADPVTALANRAAWCPSPSASSPCLVQILPGVYDVGAAGLTVPGFVDVAGAGQGVTRLIGAVDGANAFAAVVNGESDTGELRDLTVEQTGSFNAVAGVLNMRSLRHVTVLVSTGVSINSGIIASNGFSTSLEDVTVVASGSWSNEALKGIWGGSFTARNVRAFAAGSSNGTTTAFSVFDGTHELTNVDLRAQAAGGGAMALMSSGIAQVFARNVIAVGEGAGSRGVYMGRGTATIEGSQIAGEVSLEIGGYSNASAFVGHSRLDGAPTIVAAGSSLVCAAVTDENFAFFPSTCP